ncbi:MAG: hypothetical protein M1831_007421 [Alyxoria varia]|nr:MAG: hypothetical protein M1831_007421 [Alyxoria varia]
MPLQNDSALLPSTNRGYDSDNDSGDDLINQFYTQSSSPQPQHETVATIPIPNQNEQTQPDQSTFQTQPTQILSTPFQLGARRYLQGRGSSSTPVDNDRSSTPQSHHPGASDAVQVAASSPTQRSPVQMTPSYSTQLPSQAQNGFNNGGFASAMAPPGTQFRHPTQQATQHQTQTYDQTQPMDITDDERKVDSSDEDDNRNDIKPSVLTRGGQPIGPGRIEESPGPFGNAFKSHFSFNDATPQKRSADAMANAYAGLRSVPKRPRQNGPTQANAPQQDMGMDQIMDYEIRSKVTEIRDVYIEHSIKQIYQALMKSRGNKQDAQAILADQRPGLSQVSQAQADKLEFTREASPSKPSMKHEVKAKRTINEKWLGAPVRKNAVEKSAVELKKDEAGKPPQLGPESVDTTKPRRRLIRKKQKSPTPDPSSSPPPVISHTGVKPPPGAEVHLIESDDDSGVAVEPEVDSDIGLGDELLSLLNSCVAEELIELTGQPKDVVDHVLAQRPFTDLAKVNAITSASVSKTKTGSKKTLNKKYGERVVDSAQQMLSGYRAVDELVTKCERMGKPLSDEISLWGVDSGQGELEMTNFDHQSSTHDSGIGTPASSIDEEKSVQKKKPRLTPQPSIMDPDVTLKDYQVVGVNWLSMLFKHKLSGILADEMGLGKTCQVIAFLANLLERENVRGPHLVIVPGSTLENWLREFEAFCPTLNVKPYYGLQKEREEIKLQLEEEMENINVVVTTYDMATKKHDAKFLRRKVDPVVCVYDEGHMLKNSNSEKYKSLMTIPAQFRLLLTGTPLQNNLHELVSLLNFIMPSVFQDASEDLEIIFKYKARLSQSDQSQGLLSAQRINRARSMMTPFILRRKKQQVLKQLPQKTNRVEYCILDNPQRHTYDEIEAQTRATLTTSGNAKTNANVLMDLRKAAIHPHLLRREYTDAVLHKITDLYIKSNREKNHGFVFEDMTVMTDFELHRFCKSQSYLRKFAIKDESWLRSAKVKALLKILHEYKRTGHRVLVFSQFTMVMDILEQVFDSEGIGFSRLDGSTPVAQRQELIDVFKESEDVLVFMLSTKAGGLGLNLTAADRVVIFDSGFNPHDDVQAENRAHRVGQTKDVEVVRLVAKDTIEEKIYALGESKLVLDQRVAGFVESTNDDSKLESEGKKLVEEMLQKEEAPKPVLETKGSSNVEAALEKDAGEEVEDEPQVKAVTQVDLSKDDDSDSSSLSSVPDDLAEAINSSIRSTRTPKSSSKGNAKKSAPPAIERKTKDVTAKTKAPARVGKKGGNKDITSCFADGMRKLGVEVGSPVTKK